MFATSGGSNIGKTAEKLMPYVAGGEIVHAEVLKNTEELKEWVKNVT